LDEVPASFLTRPDSTTQAFPTPEFFLVQLNQVTCFDTVSKNRILKIIDSFFFSSRILSNMFRDRASILMQAKAKRMPTSATTVVGFGLVSVKQKMDKNKAPL